MAETVYTIKLNSTKFESDLARLDRKVAAFEARLRTMTLGGIGGLSGAGAGGGGARRGMVGRSGSARGLTGSFLGLNVSHIAAAAAVAGVARITASIVRLGTEAEKAQLTLGRLLSPPGSSLASRKLKGAEAFRATQVFAKNTPFNFQEVLKQRVRLGARGVSEENQLPLLRILGNYSSVLGPETLPFLSKATGDVIAKGRLQGTEIRQFEEAGVGIRQLVADFKGIDLPQVEKTFISARDVVGALKFGAREGTVFWKAMEEASKTVGGRFEKLTDTLQIFFASVGEIMLPTLSVLLEDMNSILESMSSKNFAAIMISMTEAAREMGKAFLALGGVRVLTALGSMIEIASLGGQHLGQSTRSFSLAIRRDLGFDISKEEAGQLAFDKTRTAGATRSAFSRLFGGGEDEPPRAEGKTPLEKLLDLLQFNHERFGNNSGNGGTGGGGSSVSGIRGGKSLTINIENVVREQIIHGDAGLGDTPEQIEKVVGKAMMSALSDTQIAGLA